MLLTLPTGFTGLVYEVTWQKSLAILLVSHGEATAAVLAIFLGGLSTGYSLFGSGPAGAMTPKRARSWTRRFGTDYFHGLPFEHAALETIWSRCREPACWSARRKTFQLLGGAPGGDDG